MAAIEPTAPAADDGRFKCYFSGERLYGDDLSGDDVDSWFDAEREGYADLWGKDRTSYAYEYHALNELLGFRLVPRRRFGHVLSVGGAYGDELLPVVAEAHDITILEPSDKFAGHSLGGKPITYVKPHSSGDMPFDDGRFDLITAFGCLHHVPNVSHAIREVHRVLAPGGFALIRDPIVTMGDWRRPRPGLTPNERGIPLQLFRDMIAAAGLEVVKETLCVFPVTTRLSPLFGGHVFNSRTAVRLDRFLSRLFAFNVSYHPQRIWQRLQPTAVAYVLQKTARPST